MTATRPGPAISAGQLPDEGEHACLLGFLGRLQRDHPECHALVDRSRVDATAADGYGWRLGGGAREFSDETDGGRGGSYREAQRLTFARAQGARALLGLLAEGRTTSGPVVVLDVLGGDGLVARIAGAWAGAPSTFTVLTSDIAPAMVDAALEAGLPALWQPAQQLLLKDGSVDGVLCAYGTHHLDRDSLVDTCREARRALRPGGRTVLHDFEPGSGVARWFSDVVHRHSLNGHAYPHYGSEVLAGALRDQGYESVATGPLADPIVAPGASPAAARMALARYLYRMYGLIGLGDGESTDVLEQVLSLAESSFGPITIDRAEAANDPYRASLPRVAAYAVGTSPAT